MNELRGLHEEQLPNEQYIMLQLFGNPGIPVIQEWNLVVRPKKIDPNKPVTEPDFESERNRTNCTADECNYKPTIHNRSLPEFALAKSRMRGHLMVIHGFSTEQIMTDKSKPNRWFKGAFETE